MWAFRRFFVVLCGLVFVSIPALAITVSPSSATVTENATKQFTASTASTWTTTCGSVSSAGLFKAPLYPSTTCKVTATATNGSGTVSAAVTVVSAIVMTPVSAKTPQGKTQQFTANMPVTWTAKCGTISASGLFTASGTVGSSCTIEAIATGTTKYTAYGYDTITAPTSTTPTVTPASATVTENATQQFTASTASTWTTTCGSISSTGLFKAPLYPSTTCKVTATATNGSGSASATINVVSAIVMTPVSAKTPQGKTQQFTANMPVSWTAKCGTISASGLYTASGTVGSTCTIEAIATGTTKYTAYGYDSIVAPASTTLTISPLGPTVKEGATQQFTASLPSTFTASCGSISTSGLYTAPLAPGSCTITATSTNGSGSTSTFATVTSPITISPASAVTAQGQTQQFSASTAVSWSATCGSISAAGLFTASATSGSACTIKAIASSGTAYTATAVDTIGAASALTISPLSPTLPAGTQQQFTSSTPSTWTASCGSIGATTGLYTTPATPGSCTITATATDGSGHVTSTVATISAALAVTPAAATTAQGQTQQFTANYPVTWTASCGSINTTGLFTASATAGSVCTITATTTSGPKDSATAKDTIGAPAQFILSPLNPAISENATQQFTASASATFSASCGSISSSGLYTAPLVAESCKVTATATDGSGATASTDVAVSSPITITPSSVALHALNTQSFSANQAVTWSASCGSVSSTGVFTAPPSTSSCTITATATGTPAYTAQASANIDMIYHLRWRNNQGGTGLQFNELLLTPSNVNSSSFGQVWSAAVDGGVWAQPLYVNALTVNGAPHNVLYVATDNDSVYALDADTGAQLWHVSLLPAGATAVAGSLVDDTNIPSIGVLGTPAIDKSTLYVVAETAEQNGTSFVHRLHALSLVTGAEKLGGPVLISDPNLQPAHKLQRPGLTVANGTVYVAMGSLGDKQPYHGLLFGFNETTLAQTGVWNSTPTGDSGGIWQAGGAPSVDSAGNVYVITGNGYADGVNNFGESAVKLSPSLQVLDFFSPYNAASLTASDLDLGSASVPVMPDQNGPYPHVLIFCGKSPNLYVVNRDSMGHMGSTSDNIIQELTNAVGGSATARLAGKPCFTSPSAWGNNVYFAGNGDVLKQFTLDQTTGLLSTSAVHQGTFAYGWPGSQSMISSNGNANGIIWTFDNVGKTLRADDASDVSKSLYVSPAINTGYLKWTTPMVVNGHVYVGGNGTVVAFSTK